MFLELARAELKLLYRRRQELINPLIFFLMVCTLFPLAVSPDAQELKAMAPGIIWVAAMLSVMLSLDMMFRHDFDDGTLEQLTFSGESLYLIAMVKVACYWLMTCLPLVVLSPVLGLMLFLPSQALFAMIGSLLLGTPVLVLIGSIGAALTVSLKKGGVILALLVLPLFMPVLIFGSSAVSAASQSLPVLGQLVWLAAFLVAGCCMAPLATSMAIKISVSSD